VVVINFYIVVTILSLFLPVQVKMMPEMTLLLGLFGMLIALFRKKLPVKMVIFYSFTLKKVNFLTFC
jgi:hypothetical protein